MRLIDADHVLEGIEELKGLRGSIVGKMYQTRHYFTSTSAILSRKEAVDVVRDLCIKKEPTVGGWISVKDRLPKTGTLALVFGSAGAMTVARYIAANEWLVPGIFSAITHWMPLPEPPKEEDG